MQNIFCLKEVLMNQSDFVLNAMNNAREEHK